MSTQLKHRCGGTLSPRPLAIRSEEQGLIFQTLVPGLVCDRCHEELIDRQVAREIERNQTPTIWFAADLGTSHTAAINLGGVMSSLLSSR